MVRTSNLLFWSALVSVSAVAASSPAFEAPQGRVLRAATRRSDLFRRSMRIEKKYNAELSFVEVENGWSDEEVFASTLKVGSEAPIMNLEEIEHHISSLECSRETIKIRFVDAVSARDATAACHGGMIITSHEGCNVEGERAVYKVEKINFPDDDTALHVSVKPTQWKDAFTRFDLDFGYTTDNHIYRRHSDFTKIRRRRQEDEASGTLSPSVSSSILSLPVPTDVATDQTEVTFDLSRELIDATFSPSDIPDPIGQIIQIPNIPLVVGCRNCSTTGTLLISQGSISIDMSKADVVPDVLEGEDDNRDLFSVITGGFFELKADNVAAHLDMFARPQVGAEFEIPLPEIPITPFTIPGVGMAGVSFAPVINLKYEVTGGVELNFGFDVAVPSNSRIHIDLTNLPASSVQGLPNTTITPLPLTANITDIDLTTSVAFRPTIPIGFKFLDTLNATVSVVLDLPRLDAKLTTRDNADENCNALNASVELPGPLKELGPLVLVETNVSLGVGIGMGLGFPKLPIGLNSLKTEINLFETSFPVATECVAPGKGWEAATKIWSGAAGAEVTPSGSVVVVETAPCSTTAVDVQPTPTPSQGYASFPPKNESGVVPPTGTGGFVPSATPTGPPIDQFTGLAGKMGLSMGWQVMLLGIGFVAGGMILL